RPRRSPTGWAPRSGRAASNPAPGGRLPANWIKRLFGHARSGRTAKLRGVIEARDTGSPETARKGRGRDFWPEDKPGRRVPGPKVLFGAAAALVAVVVAVVAVLVFAGGDEAPAGEPAVLSA